MNEWKTIDEEVIINIIMAAGTANSMLQQAYMETVAGNEEKAEEMLAAANEELIKAHEVQTDLLSDEANGNHAQISLLMVHAQDHLMNAILCKQLITNMIEMQKQINELKNK
ncbi:PTS lactose/cellobiose transporter subunit IIA [Chakrabartyella piscis]|uniref:PTS lactose/cellobiose transporter subunit IIA n=1 Tax=Chakrabartyella piscis TaxID=2918914 RepID=UPI002958904D|nr:PTS lactose/cellobiose transporter subunit IIA [Chakrabartyella piscis]